MVILLGQGYPNPGHWRIPIPRGSRQFQFVAREEIGLWNRVLEFISKPPGPSEKVGVVAGETD
jgi:hypothetical protein